jgi:hypothetical protein
MGAGTQVRTDEALCWLLPSSARKKDAYQLLRRTDAHLLVATVIRPVVQ